jgi:hypothetical protein
MHKKLLDLVLILFLTGCGPVHPELHQVRGKVTFNQQPIADALVTLHPLQGNLSPLPIAYTRADGQFEISWLGQGDGAPSGDYAITITWKQLIQQGEEKVRSGKNLLPAKYADPQKTPWRCSIKPGENLLPVYDIK